MRNPMRNPMPAPLPSILTVVALLYANAPLAGQEVQQRRLDPSTSLLIGEIGAIAEATAEDQSLTFGTVLPKSVRPESNRGVDVREGDRLLMLNGQRVRTIAALRELYEGLAEGDEVKMALRRDGQPFLVSFARGAAGEDGVFVNRRGNSTGVRVIRAGGDGGDVELLHEARVLLGEQDGEVRVLNRLLDEAELHEGDVVVALNGQSVGSLADFRRLYGTMQVGQALRFELRRDKETLEVHLDKAEVPAGMMIRRSADGRR